jgi:dihydrofolate reductase
VGAIDVHEFMSLDGVIDEPRWTAEYGFDPRMGEALGAAMATCRGILLGRATYEMFAPAWSARTAEDDPAAIERLKEEVGGDLYVSGSGTLVRAMLEDGLVDELGACESYDNGVVYLAYRGRA